MSSPNFTDTITALATPQGIGALAIIRLSGKQSIPIINSLFKGKNIQHVNTHTLHFGSIRDEKNTIIDEVVVSVFKAPKSFTKEDAIEVSCHGSMFIVKRILELCIKKGARLARPGEFTQRAFLNGKFDLAQAEAVADLIHADSELARKTALNQMKGGISKEIKLLREELIHFSSMIELELDFSEEDVEFANREQLKALLSKLHIKITTLINSFSLGNVLKNGIPTVIIGKPNVGKSTLLNALLNEQKAIVSEIPGTTRDSIEEVINIRGITFRLIDTAGLRETNDTIEAMGISRTKEHISKASLLLYIIDLTSESYTDIQRLVAELDSKPTDYILIGNKADLLAHDHKWNNFSLFPISAKMGTGIKALEEAIINKVNINNAHAENTIITNIRHYEQLAATKESILAVIKGIDSGITHDFLAQDIRYALHHLGEITGEITSDEILGNIFSKFCIGK